MTVMLYVKNVNRAVNFWTSIGFDEIFRVSLGTSESVAFSNPEFGNVMLQVYEEYYIKEANPEVPTNNPNLLFSVEDIELAYEAIAKETKRISDIFEVGEEFSFSFYDFDGNQFAVRGPKIEHGLRQSDIESYFKNLSNAKLINARDVEFLPDASLIFFGNVTSAVSRKMAEELAQFHGNLNYVDTQNSKISSDLKIIMQKYSIVDDIALIRRNQDGTFKEYTTVNEVLGVHPTEEAKI